MGVGRWSGSWRISFGIVTCRRSKAAGRAGFFELAGAARPSASFGFGMGFDGLRLVRDDDPSLVDVGGSLFFEYATQQDPDEVFAGL
jgi:hypothetical protein